MNAKDLFDHYFTQCPLVAIIRGVTPDEAEATGRALYDGGIRIIEVPLNSPDPFTSIRKIGECLGDQALVGAGTVVDVDDVARVKDAGGRIVVSPNMNAGIIAATVAAGMVSSPGIFTPTEAFSAIHCGAHAIKLFPAEAASPKVVKSIRAVLPKDVRLLVVGGVTTETMGGWLSAGADGFGLGGGIYKAGQSPTETLEKARAYVAALGA
jgi:2-dehydro-3-deoxyphosphogalactonate aldolase